MQTTTLFLGSIGWTELLVILVITLVLFGGKKIPTLAKDLGTGIRELKKSLAGTTDEISYREPENTPVKRTRTTTTRKKKTIDE
jgi:sec-independent protein translocase protein TatA